MNYFYAVNNTANDGVWTYSGYGDWDNNGGGDVSFSLNDSYTTADGISGSVEEEGSESFSYNYEGHPDLEADGQWSWSSGNGTASGNGSSTWHKQGSTPTRGPTA